MKTRSLFLATLVSLFVSAFLVSCDDDDDKPEIPVEASSGYYFLNSGKKGNNNSSLSFYSVDDKKMTSHYFEAKNGRKLGDTGQDMIIYGSKMYIAVYGSGTVEVTDLEGNSLKQVKDVNVRAFTTAGGYVYMSLVDGYVARMDTTIFELNKTEVGRNPEQMVVSGSQLYVANSGGMDYNTPLGYDKTVSVVDLNSFKELRKIEVGLNPCNMVADSQGNIYLISMGNYQDIPNVLQKIDKNTDEVSAIGNATEMTLLNDKLYLYYSQYDANWNQTITFYVYDTKSGSMKEGFFTDGTTVAKPYKLSADPESNTLFIMESDYTNNGDVYLYNEKGELQEKLEVGLNPIKAIAVSYYKEK